MTITKYEASIWGGVRRVKCSKQSAKTVTLIVGGFDGKPEERKANKLSDGVGYFDTWEEAKYFIVGYREAEVAKARRKLEYVNGQLGNAKGMKKPVEP